MRIYKVIICFAQFKKRKQNNKNKRKIKNKYRDDMDDDVAQQERSNINCYASAFRYI